MMTYKRGSNMTIRKKISAFLVALWLGLGALAAESCAATISASSLNIGDVTAAVLAAASGDTVQLPAGSATWISTLIISKPITLMGAGANLTTLINGGTSPLVTIALSSDQPIRVTGIFFDNVANTGGERRAIQINGKTSSGSGQALTQVRIDHCKFNKGSRQLSWIGWAYGVADHNTFVNGNIAIYVQGDNTLAWGRPIAAGTVNAVFVEDNTFIMNDSADVDLNEQIYHQEGGRSVTRYNTFDGRARTSTDSIVYDTHGNWEQPSCGSGSSYFQNNVACDFRGQPIVEFYNNTVAIHHSYRIFNIRGGSNIFYNNTITYTSGSTPTVFALTDEEGWQTILFNPLKSTRSAEDQVNNSFFWNNTLNGSALTNVTLYGGAEPFIQQNRDYFMHAPAATGGWTTYTSRAGGDMSFSSSGPNAYYPYTPFVYPHPLAGGGAGPSPPQGLGVQ